MKPQLIDRALSKVPLSCSPACPREGPAGFISRIPRSSPGLLLLLPYLYSFSVMSSPASPSSSLRSGAVQFKKNFRKFSRFPITWNLMTYT